jgi:hypothetical protein
MYRYTQEDRVASLEAERERLADALRAATRVATEAIDAGARGSGAVFDDNNPAAAAAAAVLSPSKAGPRAAAAAAALAAERARAAALEDKLRVGEAKSDADRATTRREIEELKQKLRRATVDAAEAERVYHSRRRRGNNAPGAAGSPDASPPSSSSLQSDDEDKMVGGGGAIVAAVRRKEGDNSGETYGRLLKEQRDERKIGRLEAELYQCRVTNDALRRQMRALQSESVASGDDEDIDDDDQAGGLAAARGNENVIRQSDNTADKPGKRMMGSSDANGDVDKLGAEGAAEDAAELLKAIDALRTAAVGVAGDATTKRQVLASADAAEPVVWRRVAAAAVLQRRLRRSTSELSVAHKGLKGLQGVFDRERSEWAAKENALRAAARNAEDELIRERATGGVRTALAEEAERLAKEEASEARVDAEEARAAAAAAAGAGGGRAMYKVNPFDYA